MTRGYTQQERPEIRFYYQPGSDKELVETICAGIEEEGVPFWQEAREEEDPVILAYTAARESRLEVGIGLTARGGAAVHFQRLAAGRPLFTLSGTEKNRNQLARVLGSNAARLVKGIPFKPPAEVELPEPGTGALPAARQETKADQRELIRRIVEAVLAQGFATRR